MSATQIYIASAGSGKTFTIVKEYLKIIFSEAQFGNYTAFKNILAITFTNKATLEMKQRIVYELKQIALGKETDQLKLLQNHFQNIKDFKGLADKVLVKLLHDFSNFNILTIDSFFQNIIKVFAKELNLPLNYEIIIDEKEGITFAVDELMNQIGRDKTITKWLEEFAYAQLDEEKTWDFRSILEALSKEVFHKEDDDNQEVLTLEQINVIKNKLLQQNRSFEESVFELAQKANQILEQIAFPSDGLNSNFSKPLKKLADKEKAYELSITFKNCISGEVSPIKKTTEKKYAAAIDDLQNTSFFEHLTELNVQFDEQYPIYIGYKAIYQNIYALAVVKQVTNNLKLYREENNALFLTDTAKLINGFITIDDTPFLFEKLANRIQYLFIDEFQDTSQLQWENLRPIVENILSSAERPLQVLIVGDAKQSIYRFRGGDFELLTHKAANSLMNYDGEPITLNDNYRSLPTIVQFNNTFFDEVVQASSFSNDLSLHSDMKKAYDGLHQNNQLKNPEGRVELAVLSHEEEDYEPKALSKMIDDIEHLKSIGYRLEQIAILVKTKRDGVKVSKRLQSHGIEIVSQETLLLLSDSEVKLLMAGLTYIHQKNEPLFYVSLLHHFALCKRIETENHVLFSDSKTKILLSEWCPDFETTTAGEQSLLTLFEHLLLLFDIKASDNLFVSHFKQVVINYYKNQSTNLSDFLEWWAVEGPAISVVVEDSENKIKVMTIHKSKGLEFPVVLMPFCNWSFKSNFHKNYIWVKDSTIQEGIHFPIKTISKLENSIYAEPFLREIKLNWMDNINQLYVAFTRAKEVLIVTCPFEKLNSEGAINTSAQLINVVLNRLNETVLPVEDFIYEKGLWNELPAPLQKEETAIDSVMINAPIYKIKHLEIDHPHTSVNIKIGNLVHQALFYLGNNEATTAFTKAAAEANFSEVEMETAKAHFYKIISKECQYGQWLNVALQAWDEQTIYFNGTEFRPDKVMELKDKIVIVDFKTGEPLKVYNSQMRQYMQAVKSMEAKKPIEGYVLYTENGYLEAVME
jgi:ATP-dependent helicase/nuclease subunit A